MAAQQTLSEEQKKEIRRMLASEAWRIALDRLDRLSTLKEREKAASLRVHSFDMANRLQGILDGIDYVVDTIENMTINDKVIEEEPSY